MTNASVMATQHHHRHRRPVAHLPLGEEAPEDREADDLGGRSRASGGQQVDLVEDLDPRDRAEHEGHHDRGQHHRQRDVAQLLEERRPVHVRGLVHVLRQALEAGEHQQEHEGRPVPDVHGDDGEERRGRIAEPLDRRQSERAEHLVQHAEVEVVHQLPDGADDDARHEDRQDEHGAVRDAAARDPRRHQREEESQHHLRRDGGHREHERRNHEGQTDCSAPESTAERAGNYATRPPTSTERIQKENERISNTLFALILSTRSRIARRNFSRSNRKLRITVTPEGTV